MFNVIILHKRKAGHVTSKTELVRRVIKYFKFEKALNESNSNYFRIKTRDKFSAIFADRSIIFEMTSKKSGLQKSTANKRFQVYVRLLKLTFVWLNDTKYNKMPSLKRDTSQPFNLCKAPIKLWRNDLRCFGFQYHPSTRCHELLKRSRLDQRLDNDAGVVRFKGISDQS